MGFREMAWDKTITSETRLIPGEGGNGWPVRLKVKYSTKQTTQDLRHTVRSPYMYIFEPPHEISNNVVRATSKGSDQPAHTLSLIRAFASRLSIL